jgi:hypothetical protein
MIQINLLLQWVKRLFDALLARRPRFHTWQVHVGFLVDKLEMRQIFPPGTWSIIPPMLYIQHLHVVLTRINGWSLGTFQKQCSFIKREENTFAIIRLQKFHYLQIIPPTFPTVSEYCDGSNFIFSFPCITIRTHKCTHFY